MTRDEFKRLPYLVVESQLAGLGYDRRTLDKLVECAVLRGVKPPGAGHKRYQKKQVAQLLGWDELVEYEAFRQERPMMGRKAVQRWTGYAEESLAKMVAAGGLTCRRPPGTRSRKYLKKEIAELIGMEGYV